MKRKVLMSLCGISTAAALASAAVCAEEYYDDGSYEISYEEGYIEEVYDDGSYVETYDEVYEPVYDEVIYDQSYDSSYDQSYDSSYDQSYDTGSYDQNYYDSSLSADATYYEESYSEGENAEAVYSEETASSEENTSTSVLQTVTITPEMLRGVTSDISEDDPSWFISPRLDIERGDNSARETADENGMVHSYLTGELVSQETAFSRPIAIMINNIIDALPQAGIAQASVIYEAPVEGNITRLLAVYEDVSGLEKIGPVRSCRDYFIDFAMEFDAIYMHFGQAVYAYDLLNSEMVNNISGLEYQDGVGKIDGYAGEEVFYRTDDRPSPHNCYTSETGIAKAMEKKGYSTELDNTYQGHFKFASDGESVVYSEGTATHIVPHLYTNNPYFDYDENTQKYYRYEYPDKASGPEHIDQLTGEQLSVDNVIIQYCAVKPYDDHGYLNINTNSGGEAILFTKGTYQHATWVKDSDWGPARYYDDEGNEIAINQGKTWVCIVQDTKKTDTSFE